MSVTVWQTVLRLLLLLAKTHLFARLAADLAAGWLFCLARRRRRRLEMDCRLSGQRRPLYILFLVDDDHGG